MSNDKICTPCRTIIFGMDVIYIDELFIMNLIIDYLIVLASGRVCGVKLRRLRYLLAAVLGAAYACGEVLDGFGFLSMPAAKLGCGAIMCVIAFCSDPRPFRCAVTFFAVSAAFGGAVWAASLITGGGTDGYIPMSFEMLAISFALCYAVVSLVFRRAVKKAGREILPVGAVFAGHSAVFRALKDTGNGLFDPLTGCEVLVISPRTAGELLPEECRAALELTDPVSVLEALGAVPGMEGRFRLIPYSAVGVKSGLLPAFRPDALTVDGKPADGVMLAVSTSLAGENEYEAVF